ncbi:MAG: PIN domain-containing protein, partial [Verrucomicrobiota bacterium]
MITINQTAGNLARTFFVTVSCLLGIAVSLSFQEEAWVGALAGTCFGLFVVVVDIALQNFTLRGFSNATVGLMVGLFCAWLITRVDVFEVKWWSNVLNDKEMVKSIYQLVLYMTFGFLGVSFGMRSNREEFSFLIPYVRFRQDSAQDAPLLVDTNIIIDGRIPKICETGFLSGALVIPRFVLDELHVLADAPDAIKQERGKRGLECLNQMQNSRNLEVTVHEDYQEREALVDTKLIQLARRLGARLLTNDGNLGKVARLQGVTVLNLNQLARAMRPMVMPGDPLELKLVKEGKDPHQAVGYLPDGTMIVVNNSIHMLGKHAEVIVGGTTPTSAGRLIFAELVEAKKLRESKQDGNGNGNGGGN